MSGILLRDIVVETKDGDWGKGEPSEDSLPYFVIRGTDFQDVAMGDISAVPVRHLPRRTVGRRTLRVNDILLETAGGSPGRPTGRTLLLTERALHAFPGSVTCASFARFLRVNPELAYPAFIYWVLQNLYKSGHAEQYQVQHTGVARFQYTDFASTYRVNLPDRSVQVGIADVLGALDDKISANAGLIEDASVLGRIVYDEMDEAEAGPPLTAVAKFVNGKAFTKNATGTGRVVIRIAELNSGIGGSTVYNDIDVADDYLARPGDLLFAWSGSLTVHRWFREEAIINQHIFKVVPQDGYPVWLVHQLLQHKLEEFRAIAADKATTMGHIQRRHLEEPVRVPSRQAIAQRDELMSSLWRLALNAECESLTLAELRDTLLPQLMSGRLRVKDAEKQVEEVV